jgi:hypothetical protein
MPNPDNERCEARFVRVSMRSVAPIARGPTSIGLPEGRTDAGTHDVYALDWDAP